MRVYNVVFVFCVIFFTQTIKGQEIKSHKEITQNEQSIIVGFGPTLEIKNSLYGINGRVYYGVNESFCFGPEISFFPFQKIEDNFETAITDLNFNAHYIVELNSKIGLYPLSGINYTIEQERLNNSVSETEKAFGINYGAGIHYKLNDLFVFTEFKGVLGQLNAEFLTIGFIYSFIKKPKK